MIDRYRSLYTEDLAERLGVDNETLPSSLGIPVLLNPVFGSRERIIGLGLMMPQQYTKAEHDLLERMQDALDRKNPVVSPIFVDSSDDEKSSDDDDSSKISSGSSSSEEEEQHTVLNSNHALAKEQFTRWMSWRHKKFLPETDKVNVKTLIGEGDGKAKGKRMRVGKVAKRGKDLPSGNNIADYIDNLGGMDVAKYTGEHRKEFDIVWLVVQCESSRRVVEVGCERFFNLSGYVSSAKRTTLVVRNYERLAMLSSIIQNVFIHVDWGAKEYISRTNNGQWKKENMEDALKCWNLERAIGSEAFGKAPPNEITFDDYLRGDLARM